MNCERSRVLVVDDDPGVREALLEELGEHFDVASAGSGAEALDCLRSRGFDALVSDVRMPGMDGVALVQRARLIDPTMVRVFLTAHGDDEVYQCARSIGAYKLRKPWGHELELVLRYAIEQRRHQKWIVAELGQILSAADAPPQSREGADRVTERLQRMLGSLPWIETVEVETEPGHDGSSWYETTGPRPIPGALNRMEQTAWMGCSPDVRRRVHVRWLGAVGYAGELVAVSLRQAAEALHLWELNRAVQQRTSQLEAARMELAERDRLSAVGAMAASVAHDIRTPLAVLSANREYLRTHGVSSLDAEELELMLEDDRIAIETIERVLGSLRDFASNSPTAEPVALRPHVDRAARLLRRRIEEARVELRVCVEGDPIVMATPVELEQILSNLLSNAVEVSPQSSVITVDARLSDGQVRVRVTDQGPGIPPAQSELVFRPFHTTKRRGMGLGLAISRQMARRHGGDVRLVGEGPGGRGACFELRLPAGR